MAKHEFITNPHEFARWPGNIICVKCNETAHAECHWTDSGNTLKFRNEQDERDDCPGEKNES